MYKIDLLNNISEKGLSLFTENYEYRTDISEPDGILVRSKEMKDMSLPSSVKAIARAGAGVNNIPIDKCSEKGIVVFNTPGANANGVKELVVLGMLLASRKVTEGISWAKGSCWRRRQGARSDRKRKIKVRRHRDPGQEDGCSRPWRHRHHGGQYSRIARHGGIRIRSISVHRSSMETIPQYQEGGESG